MGTGFNPNRKAAASSGQLISISPYSLLAEEEGKVQDTIWRLQDEVRVLQEELVRTRRALDQRDVLLRNSQQRELELRAESGAEKR